MLCRSLFVLLYFFFWPLCCLFFFDIRILIAPLVSSNSFYLSIKYDMHWTGTRQLGPRTTQTETSRPISEDWSARMLRQLGPYVKTTRTINNYCCLTYFFFNKIDGNHKDTYSLTSVKSIGKCKKKSWYNQPKLYLLFTHCVVMSDFYLYII